MKHPDSDCGYPLGHSELHSGSRAPSSWVYSSKHICLTVDIIFNEISIYGASMWYARQGFREEPDRVDQDTEFYQSPWKVNFITDK